MSWLLACYSFTSIFPLTLRYNILHGGWKQPTQFWLNEHAKSFWDSEFFYATLWCLSWSPEWWLAKWAQEFLSVPQGYTSFVKQTAFDPINTIISTDMNFSGKPPCTPAWYHTVRAPCEQEMSCSLVILWPDTGMVQLAYIFFSWFMPNGLKGAVFI